jgi:uncharacterized protein (TIGR03790 family)
LLAIVIGGAVSAGCQGEVRIPCGSACSQLSTDGTGAGGDGAPGDDVGTSSDAAPGDTMPGDAASGDAASGDAASGDAASGDATGGDAAGGDGTTQPLVLLPRTGITADELGVIVDDSDALSVTIAAAYVAARGIPSAHVVHLSITDPTAVNLPAAEFATLETQVASALAGTDVQALLLTWTHPYRVENMSITSAFALGYKAIGSDTCGDNNSKSGNSNPYLSQRDSTSPFTDLGFRPTMTLAATSAADAQALIDRGVGADGSFPVGTAYLMSTSDGIRSARCVVNATYGYTNVCQQLIDSWDAAGSQLTATLVTGDTVTDRSDVLFYVQGLASVPNIATNTYLPGAIADHLTSYGGQIPTSGQMSAIEWLRAGATASFGTVVEPCAYVQKFPNPTRSVPNYFRGNTLIEAYWKSVDWPAEGIFIGEPLARPFGHRTTFDGTTLTIETTWLKPGTTYVLEAAESEAGPWTTVQASITVSSYRRKVLTVAAPFRRVYRLR